MTSLNTEVSKQDVQFPWRWFEMMSKGGGKRGEFGDCRGLK